MSIRCKILGHNWTFPMKSLNGGKFPGYDCKWCGKHREESDLTFYGFKILGGGGIRK